MKEVVHRILRALNDAGFEAYVVGGAVRDLLMHKEPHDYDITTSARPEEIMDVAAKQNWQSVDVNGKTFGVVVLVIGGETYEVASFRGEVYGEDSHRPERVWYAASLREDVTRRDFTINALAMDAAGQVYDYVGGRKDLRKPSAMRKSGFRKMRCGFFGSVVLRVSLIFCRKRKRRTLCRRHSDAWPGFRRTG